ncbi:MULTISPECIES: hypothetical protein [Atlantibacter]|uniref:hypothetical protein n=1 Tax=Atlantibacter TaxID=1903434 RepID=UPI0025902AAC|nr:MULTISPECIES: hypothetical protein [Atlantibacter]
MHRAVVLINHLILCRYRPAGGTLLIIGALNGLRRWCQTLIFWLPSVRLQIHHHEDHCLLMR